MLFFLFFGFFFHRLIKFFRNSGKLVMFQIALRIFSDVLQDFLHFLFGGILVVLLHYILNHTDHLRILNAGTPDIFSAKLEFFHNT